MTFGVDQASNKAAQAMLKNAPKYYRVVMANFLNNTGFAIREAQQKQIAASMTVRNKGLLRKFLMVQKTAAKPIEQQQVTVGSKTTDRFTGWREQELGQEADKNRISMLFSRGDDKTKQVLKQNRASNFVINSDTDYGASEGNRVSGFLAHLGRINYPGLFRLEGKQYKGGVYRLKPGTWSFQKYGRTYTMPKFKKVYQDDAHTKDKKNPWNDRAAVSVLKGAEMARLADKAMEQAWDRFKTHHL